MGRKPIPVEPYIAKLEHAILLGATYELAAAYAGISIDTFDRWRTNAETAAEGTALARLRARLRHAEGVAAIGWLAKIEQAATDGDWKAGAWKLERRYPAAYGRVTASPDERCDVSELLKAVLLELAERARRAAVTPEAEWAPVPPGGASDERRAARAAGAPGCGGGGGLTRNGARGKQQLSHVPFCARARKQRAYVSTTATAVAAALGPLVYRHPQRSPAELRQALEAACLASPGLWTDPDAVWTLGESP